MYMVIMYKFEMYVFFPKMEPVFLFHHRCLHFLFNHKYINVFDETGHVDKHSGWRQELDIHSKLLGEMEELG